MGNRYANAGPTATQQLDDLRAELAEAEQELQSALGDSRVEPTARAAVERAQHELDAFLENL